MASFEVCPNSQPYGRSDAHTPPPPASSRPPSPMESCKSLIPLLTECSNCRRENHLQKEVPLSPRLGLRLLFCHLRMGHARPDLHQRTPHLQRRKRLPRPTCKDRYQLLQTHTMGGEVTIVQRLCSFLPHFVPRPNHPPTDCPGSSQFCQAGGRCGREMWMEGNGWRLEVPVDLFDLLPVNPITVLAKDVVRRTVAYEMVDMNSRV
jgi:hypothetical protein